MREFYVNMCDLSPDSANAMFQFAHVVAHGIHGATNVTQMLNDDVVRLGHVQDYHTLTSPPR